MTIVVGLVAAAVTGGGLFVASLRVPVSDDEAWFLQVVDRCRSGERLYRDVFYGAGPAAVWPALAAVRFLRPQLLVLRALTVAYFVLLLAAGSWLLGGLHAPTWSVALVWVASMGFAGPSWGTDNHYGQLALVGAVVAMSAVVHRADGADPVVLSVIAGAAAAIAIAAKHNLGLVVAAGAAVALVAWRRWAVVDIAGFGLGVAVVLVGCFWPVVRAGAWSSFVLRAFTNKASYLVTGRVGLREGARTISLPFLAEGPVAVLSRAVVRASFVVVALVPPALVYDVAVVVGVAPTGPRGARPAVAGLVLGLLVLAGTYPRADDAHVRALFPMGALVLTASALAGPEPSTGMVVVGLAAILPCTAVALVVALDTRHRIPFRPDEVDRDLPHLRRLPVIRRRAAVSPADGTALRAQTDGSVFLLRPDAAVWYLAADLRNPTPFDYPYASVFGPRGQGDTVAAIERGEVRWVCLPEPMAGRLAPLDLQTYVLSSMDDVGETAAGTLYTRRASAT